MTVTASTKVSLPSWACEILRDKFHERFVITGGLGSSKTTSGLAAFFVNVLQNKNCLRWWVIAPTHARHQDAVLPAAVFALTEIIGLKPNIHFKVYYSLPQRIEFFTGQVIDFHSGDRPERMTSATLGGYFITEPGLMKKMVYEKVEDRTRSKQVTRTLGIIEGTPEGDNWYMDEFNIDKTDPERKLRRFILHTEDNKENLDPGYIDRLKRMYAYSKAKTRAYLYGEFLPFNVGNVYAQFLEHRNIIPNITADPSRPIYLCFDFNATPLTWTAWQQVNYKGRTREICINESSLKATNLLEAALEFGLAFDPAIFGNTRIEVWGDRTGHAKSHKAPGTDFTNLKKYLDESYAHVSIAAKKQVTPIRASIDITNRLFLYELLLICERCKNLRRSYNTTEWAEGKADLKKAVGETHTHHSDGPRYRHYWQYKDFDPEELTIRKTVAGMNPA